MRNRSITWMFQALVVAALAGFLAGCATDTSARDQLNAGYRALDQHQYDQAITAADTYLRKTPTGPGSAEAYYLQGRVYEERADEAARRNDNAASRSSLQSAGTAYSRGLSLLPPAKVAALLHAGLANVAYHFDDYGTAVREWQISYKDVEPADAKAWVKYRIGLCQQRLGWFAEADRTFSEVRQTFPNTEQASRAAAHLGAKAFYVQVASFTDAGNAQKTIAALQMQGLTPNQSFDAGKQVISVGPLTTYADAHAMRARLSAQYPGAVIQP